MSLHSKPGGSTLLILTNMHFCNKSNEFYSPQNMDDVDIDLQASISILILTILIGAIIFFIRQIFGQIKYVMSMYSADIAYNKI